MKNKSVSKSKKSSDQNKQSQKNSQSVKPQNNEQKQQKPAQKIQQQQQNNNNNSVKSQAQIQTHKDFKFNFWLQEKCPPKNVTKSLNNLIVLNNDKQLLYIISFPNDEMHVHVVKADTMAPLTDFPVDLSECPVINFDFIHNELFFVNGRIYMFANQNPRESQHVYVLDLTLKMLLPLKNIDTKPIEMRINHSATQYDYKILFFGGFNDQMQLNNTLESFDLSTYRWEKINAKGRTPTPRHSHSACIHQNRLIIIGGSTSDDIWNQDQSLREIYVLDLRNMIWLQIKTDDFYMPKILSYAYFQPILIDNGQKQITKYVYITRNHNTGEFQSLIFIPNNFQFLELDIFSQRPQYKYGATVCINQFKQEILIYGGFLLNRDASSSESGSIDRLIMFKNDEPQHFQSLDILGGNSNVQKMNNETEWQNKEDDELYEDTIQDFELTFEELLAMEKKNKQNEDRSSTSNIQSGEVNEEDNNNNYNNNFDDNEQEDEEEEEDSEEEEEGEEDSADEDEEENSEQIEQELESQESENNENNNNNILEQHMMGKFKDIDDNIETNIQVQKENNSQEQEIEEQQQNVVNNDINNNNEQDDNQGFEIFMGKSKHKFKENTEENQENKDENQENNNNNLQEENKKEVQEDQYDINGYKKNYNIDNIIKKHTTPGLQQKSYDGRGNSFKVLMDKNQFNDDSSSEQSSEEDEGEDFDDDENSENNDINNNNQENSNNIANKNLIKSNKKVRLQNSENNENQVKKNSVLTSNNNGNMNASKKKNKKKKKI